MFSKGTAKFPPFWLYIKKFVADRGVNIRKHLQHRTLYTIARKLYTVEDDDERELDSAMRILSRGIYQNGQ